MKVGIGKHNSDKDINLSTRGTIEALTVEVVDGSGNQVTAFSGGTEYTEGDVDTSITGTALMWEDSADILRPVSGAKPLPVDIVSGSSSGTEYTEEDTDSTITGTAILTEGPGNKLVPLQSNSAKDTLVAVNSALPSGSNAIGKLAANSGVDIGDVDILSIAAGNNNIGDVDVASIAAGDNNIGNVDIVSGTITTVSTVTNLSQQGGVAISLNTGVRDTGTQRVTIATNDVVPVSQSGTWDEVGINDSGNSITVDNAQLSVVGSGTEATAMRVTIATDSTGVLSIDDNGSTITVDNAQLSVVGSGTEATAMRVTIATDSTGVLSVDDNGSTISIDDGTGSITVDGTVTASIAAGATTIAKAEDVASADADVGVGMLAVRKATPANTSGADGDYEFIQMSAGRVWTSATIDAALPAGTNGIGKLTANSGVDIGDVDVASIAAGDNNIGNVDVETLPAIPAGDNNIGNVDVASIAAGDNNIGNVDIDSIAAGDNNIGNVDVASMANLTESLVDDAAFTPATSRVVPVGFEFDDSTPDSVNEGDIGAARMSGNRNIYTTIRDAAGNERGVNVSAGNALIVDGSAVTQPVSLASVPSHAVTNAGTFAVQDATAQASLSVMDDWDNAASDGASVSGDVAHDAADAGEPVKIGGKAISAEPAVVAANDRVNALFDLVGKLIVLPYANPENFVSGAITTAMTGTTSTSLVAAPAAGLRNYLTTIIVSNAHATVGTDIVIQDGSGGTTLLTIPAASVYGGAVVTLPTPLRQPTTATAIYCANVTTGASTKVSAVGYKGV